LDDKRRYLLEPHNGPRQNRTLRNMIENAIQAVGLQRSVIGYQQRFIDLKVEKLKSQQATQDNTHDYKKVGYLLDMTLANDMSTHNETSISS